MAKAWPAIEPATTSTRAASSTLTPKRWNRGSRPVINGTRQRPVASHEVAIQSIPNCTCQVRERE